MSDDEDLSFRERVQKIRERRQQSQSQQQSQGGQSQQQISQNVSISMGQGSGAGGGFEHETRTASHVTIELPQRTLEFTNVAVQRTRLGGTLQYGVSGRPDGANATEQPGMFGGQQFEQKQLTARKVVIEYPDETLEFDNVHVLKSIMSGQHLYGVQGDPDRRHSTDSSTSTRGQNSSGSSVEESKTRIVDDSSTPSTDGSETVVWTGDDEETSSGGSTESEPIQYCPGCSADLSNIESPSFCHECGRDVSDLG